MSSVPPKILVIGYGNPGRLDDGLGPAFADALEKMDIHNLTVDSNYQLTVEDSSTIAEHDHVIFVDAHVDCTAPFEFKEITPEPDMSFTTHSISPEAVLGLAVKLFHAKTRGYVLGIRGYKFNEFGEKLSEKATKNMAAALQYIKPVLLKGVFDIIESKTNKATAAVTPHTDNGEKQWKTANT